MGVENSYYPVDGRTKTYPQAKHIATKQHARCFGRNIATELYNVLDSQNYDLINNAIVFQEAVSATVYNQIEIRVADTQEELGESASSIAIVASIATEVVIVAGIEDEVVTVSDNNANVTLVGDDLALGLGTNQPTDSSILNALTNADIAIANAALTAADVVSTGEDLALTNADVVTAEASKEFANDWAVSPTLVDDGVNPIDKSARTYALEAAAYSPTTNLSQVAVSKQTAGDITISNVVSIVSDSDPFLDASQVFKYELDGNTLDTDQVTPVDGTPTNITYYYEGQKFGTAQAVFNGTTSKILGTASIASNAFTYSMVITPDTVDATDKILIDFTTGRGVLLNGSASGTNKNLSYYDGVGYNDLGYKLTVGKQETVGITVNGTTLKLFIGGLLHSTHTVASTSIDGVFAVGSKFNGASDFFKGKIDQPEVYNRTLTDAEMESLYFQEITRTDNLITTTDVEVAYHNGYNLGAVNTAEALTNLGRTVTLSASAWNYLYTVEGSDVLTATPYEPVYGKNNKRTVAGYNPDIVDGGFTFSSSGGDELAPTLALANWGLLDVTLSNPTSDVLRATATGATQYVYFTMNMVAGEKYKFKIKVKSNTAGTAGAIYIKEGSAGIGYANTPFTYSTSEAVYDVDFVALSTDLAFIQIYANVAIGDYVDISLASFFETNIEKDTAYVTPRTYLNTKIEADSAGKPALAEEWIGSSLVERRGVFEDLEVSNDLEAKGKLVAPNACTAWVNFDGTTTPPTIRDSFNIGDVVRTATGTFDVYFESDMDNENYSLVANTALGSGSEDLFSETKAQFRLRTWNNSNVLQDADYTYIQVFGGKD